MTRHFVCRIAADPGPPWKHPDYDHSLDPSRGIARGICYGAVALLWVLAALAVLRLLSV